MPDELKQLRAVRSNPQAVTEIERFWRRRDPTPEDQENPFRTTFQERAVAADRLYAEGNRRGSLTDRGRALVLFGAPSVLRYRQRTVPALGRTGRPGPKVGLLSEEVWVYLQEDLPEAFLALLTESERQAGIEMVFVTEGRHTRLTEGARYCELMPRAALREP